MSDDFDDLGEFELPPDAVPPPREPAPPPPREPALPPPDLTELQPVEPGLDPTAVSGDPDDLATRSLAALEDLTRAPRRRRRAEPAPAPPEKTRRAAASRTAHTRKARAAGPEAPPVASPGPFAAIERPWTRAIARRGRTPIPRIAAPVVFLVAVVVLIGVLVSSGGQKKATTTTQPAGGKKTATTKPTATSTTKPTVATTYVVKPGDTISGIAIKFHTTQTAIEALNPNMDPNTLSVGEKLKLPPPGQ